MQPRPRLGGVVVPGSPSSAGPAVEVTDLVMRYGDKTAVDGLSLTIDRGSVTAVLGPNGAGKTTTLETCEGFRRPQSGSVRVLGLDPRDDRRALLPRIGVMLQSGGAWSGVRAVEMLSHVASLHAHPLSVDMLVERLGLGSCGRTSYRRLSGGQQQRLSLAMAVVGRPELLFVDEPTAGMDPQARRDTWDLLREVRDDGVTTVLTTHYLEEAEKLADQVHIIDHGRLIASGSPFDLTRGAGSATIRLVVTRPFPPGAPAALQSALGGRTEVTTLNEQSLLVTGPADASTLGVVSAWCTQQEVLPESLTPGPADPRGRLPPAHRTRVHPVSGTFAPRPGAAPLAAMVLAQVRMETRLLLRNGEQLLLALVVPVLVLFGGVKGIERLDLSLSHTPIDELTPGVLALAVMSTAFTSLAIATGFERRYGVLKRLGASPLPRQGLLLGKVGALLLVEVLQGVVITLVALVLGWSPTLTTRGLCGVLVMAVLGTAAFAALGLFVAGALRAEATLAVANLVYLLLAAGGGVVLPASTYGGFAGVVRWLPSGALGGGLRESLLAGTFPLGPSLVLLGWAALGTLLTVRTFSWE